MQIFENLIFQDCSTEFYDIAHTHTHTHTHTHGPWVCVIKGCSNGGAT